MTAATSNVHPLQTGATHPQQNGLKEADSTDTRRWPNSLRLLRRTRGLTLEQLAELSDVSVSYLSRLEAGLRRLNADTIDKLTHALGCEAAELMQAPPMITGKFSPAGAGHTQTAAMTGSNAATFGRSHQPSGRDLPVYGKMKNLMCETNNDDTGNAIDFKKPIDWLQRPSDLSGVDAAFAFYINDRTMFPKFTNGDIVITHPYRPPTENSYVVIVTNENDAFVRQFISWTPQEIRLKAFTVENGSDITSYNLSELKGVYRVLMTMETL